MNSFHHTINDDYSIRSMTKDEFDPLFKKYTKIIFEDEGQVFHWRNYVSKEEDARLKTLSAQMGSPFELRLGVFFKSEFVGWHYGRQDSGPSFYMQNSAILPDHRNKGLYTELLKCVLKTTTELGFQMIWSRHNTTNNAVIIPKLKQGFVITAMEVSDMVGTIVHLNFYPNPLRRRMMDYRVGQIKADSEIKNHLGL